VACLASRLETLRRGHNTLFLAAGDMIQGNNWANFSKGRSVMQLLNALPVSAMVVGNHEFDFGQEELKKRVKEARFPVLGANVKGFPGLKPYVMKRVGGMQVAIIGVVTEETKTATHPRNVEGVEFAGAAEVVRSCLPHVKPKADLVVALTHLGFEADQELARQVPELDVIVGGHTHTRVKEPLQVGKTLIVQAWEHGKVLGVLDLEVKDGKVVRWEGRLEEIKPACCQESPKIKKLVQRYAKEANRKLDGPVGQAAVELDGQNVRRQETNLGNLVADIVRQTAGAEVALINGGGLRTSIPAGTIRVREIYNTLPFDNYLVALRMTGAQLREALDHAVSEVQTGGGRFPQVSGVRLTYDPQAPVKQRVREVWVGDQALQPEKQYVVATHDFMAAGGDGFTSFGEALKGTKGFSNNGGALMSEALTYNDPSRFLRDIVAEYVKAQGTVNPQVEGRIKTVP
jgi:2',3'-cyclic-nucleotide 2'-phosphodiesterase (5'-nucleotidase family)